MSIIPKIIHFCWFGGNPYPEMIKKCLESWEKHLPEYKIIKWDETTFDIHSNAYVEEAYNNKKWAFVSDYVRLYALYNYGGVYMDTDVEVLKPLDEFLDNFAFSGFESKDSVSTAVMASEKGHTIIKEFLDYYDDRHFIKKDNTLDTTTNVVIMTEILLKEGLILNGKKQTVSGFVLYPNIVFCPNTFSMIFGKYSKKTYTVHHFDESWRDTKRKKGLYYRIRCYLVGIARNIFGTKTLENIKKKMGK